MSHGDRVYRIAKWSTVFERAESRKLKTLTWVALPTTFNSFGYQSLLEEFGNDAPAIYGAWCSLVALAAGCSERGTLATSRGAPLPMHHLSRITGFQGKVFERLFEWASRPGIGWLEVLDHQGNSQPGIGWLEDSPERRPTANANGAHPSGDSPDYRTGQDRTGQNQENKCGVNAASVGSRLSYPLLFEDFWDAYPPNKNGRKRGKKKTYGLWKRIPDEDRESVVTAAATYGHEAGEFVRDPERFLANDFWRDYLVVPDKPLSLFDRKRKEVGAK